MTVDPILRYAALDYEPFFTKCGSKQYAGPTCVNKGVYPQFFAELSKLLGMKFQTVQANGYGIGEIDERNDTGLKMLRLGLVDFVGPHCELDHKLRGFIKSVPIFYSDLEVYTRTTYISAEYNVVDFLGKSVFWMVLFSTASIYLLPRASKLSKNRSLFVKVNNASKLLFLMTITVALNVFAGNLSVKVVQRLTQQPNMASIETIRHHLIFGSGKLCLFKSIEGIVMDITRQLGRGQTRSVIAGLNRSVLFSKDEVEFLDRIVKSECMGCHSNYGTRTTATWFDVCNRVTTTQASHIFGNTRHGFVFSPATLNRTANFRSIIHRHHRAISKLYRQVFKMYLRKKQKYWKCDEKHMRVPDSFVITMANMWNMSFKSILFVGLGTASLIFVVEFSSGLIAK